MRLLILILNMIAGSIINHLRGGGGDFGSAVSGFIAKMPGRPLYYTAPLFGLLAWPLFGWKLAILQAVANFLWGIWAWGRWYSLGRTPRAQEHAPSLFEKFIEALPGAGNDSVAFSYRNTLGQAFGAIFITPWCLYMVPIQLFAYWLAWILHEEKDGSYATGAIPMAELLYGATQGMFLTVLFWGGITNTWIATWAGKEIGQWIPTVFSLIHSWF